MLLVCAMLMVLAGSASAHTIHNALDLVRVENIVEQRNGDVAIAVSPTAVKYNGEWVTVSWSGVAQVRAPSWSARPLFLSCSSRASSQAIPHACRTHTPPAVSYARPLR